MKTFNPRLKLEALRLSRFGAIGTAATVTHLLLVSLFTAGTTLAPLTANTLAYLVSFGISLGGHYFWTFQKPGDLGQSTLRFMLVSLAAFLSNTLALAFALEAGWFSPLITIFLAAAIIPLATYLASRLWVFRVPA
jgi:putative flippase GtrA